MSKGLSINELTVEIGDKTVLNDVSIKIEPGEHVGIIGRVGCGKTTLAKLLLGLYHEIAFGSPLALSGGGEVRVGSTLCLCCPWQPAPSRWGLASLFRSTSSRRKYGKARGRPLSIGP